MRYSWENPLRFACGNWNFNSSRFNLVLFSFKGASGGCVIGNVKHSRDLLAKSRLHQTLSFTQHGPKHLSSNFQPVPLHEPRNASSVNFHNRKSSCMSPKKVNAIVIRLILCFTKVDLASCGSSISARTQSFSSCSGITNHVKRA